MNPHRQSDIAVTVNPNSNTLTGIENGSSSLVQGTDYMVSGDTATILKSYLDGQSTGTIYLTFDFSAGTDPVLTVNISQ